MDSDCFFKYLLALCISPLWEYLLILLAHSILWFLFHGILFLKFFTTSRYHPPMRRITGKEYCLTLWALFTLAARLLFCFHCRRFLITCNPMSVLMITSGATGFLFRKHLFITVSWRIFSCIFFSLRIIVLTWNLDSFWIGFCTGWGVQIRFYLFTGEHSVFQAPFKEPASFLVHVSEIFAILGSCDWWFNSGSSMLVWVHFCASACLILALWLWTTAGNQVPWSLYCSFNLGLLYLCWVLCASLKILRRLFLDKRPLEFQWKLHLIYSVP